MHRRLVVPVSLIAIALLTYAAVSYAQGWL